MNALGAFKYDIKDVLIHVTARAKEAHFLVFLQCEMS